MALYMESFFGDFKLKTLFFRINTCLMVSGIVLTCFIYVSQLVIYTGEDVVSTVPVAVKVILGYFYELYYLIYSVSLFVRAEVRWLRRIVFGAESERRSDLPC